MKKLLVSVALMAGLSAAASMAHAQSAAKQDQEVSELPTVMSYKSPTCGCCGKWEDHMRQNGFVVESMKIEDMAGLKADIGVPASSQSCHTAMVGDYFVEGHVPAEVVKSMLDAAPPVRGVSAPGMPAGSPGMEMPGMPGQPYPIHVIDLNGNASVLTTVQP